MMCSYWFFFKLNQFISEQSLDVNQEAFLPTLMKIKLKYSNLFECYC